MNTTVPDKYIQETYYHQQGKKYYLPTEAELLSRADPTFYEQTPEAESLYKHLCEKLNLDRLTADKFIGKLITTLMREDFLQSFMTLLDEFHIELQNIRQANELIGYITNLANHTRKWSNCGYTPDEMIRNWQG